MNKHEDTLLFASIAIDRHRPKKKKNNDYTYTHNTDHHALIHEFANTLCFGRYRFHRQVLLIAAVLCDLDWHSLPHAPINRTQINFFSLSLSIQINRSVPCVCLRIEYISIHKDELWWMDNINEWIIFDKKRIRIFYSAIAAFTHFVARNTRINGRTMLGSAPAKKSHHYDEKKKKQQIITRQISFF